jgi:hypothetical protein
MKKPQWITAGIALLLTVGLYALTQNQLFGFHPKKPAAAVASKGDHEGHAHAEGEGHEEAVLSVDTICLMLKKRSGRINSPA